MFKQILNTLFAKILTGILNLVIAIIISNYLGAEGKGVQGIILTTISIVVILTGVIGSGGLTYLLPRLHFSILIIPSYLWTFIVAMVLWIGLLQINIVPTLYIKHIACISILLSINGINTSILHSKKEIKKANVVGLAQIFFTVLTVTYLIVYKEILSVNSYIIGLYVGNIVSLVLSFVFTSDEYLRSRYKMPFYKYFIGLQKHFKYGGFNQLDILAQVLSFRLAFYFLNYYTSVFDVGIYSNAVSLIESVWIISRSLSFVHHSRIINSRDKNYNSLITLNFIKLSGVLGFFAIIVFVLIPSRFYEFVFGQEFGPIRNAIISLSPGILFFSLSFVISSYLSGVGKHHINSISSFVGLIVIVLSSIFLIPIYGIIGAGIAASLSYFITTLIKIFSFCRIAQVSVFEMIPRIKDLNALKENLIIKS
jgi:O-antigen/teichoic acid export membrane protein